MTAATELIGVIDGMPDETYHQHPALSNSGAKRLLPPSCPALFKHWRDNPQPHKKEFDFGKAAHRMVLGEGPDFVVVDHTDWRTNDAKQKRAEAYAAGTTPLLVHEYQQVREMAEALRRHPLAARLLQPGSGKAEQSLFALDGEHDVRLRGRLDWLPNRTGRRLLVADYKSSVSAEPGHIERAIQNYGYGRQAAWYLDLLDVLGLAPDGAAFMFIVQEKAAPYLVTVAAVDDEVLYWGRTQNRQAIATYRRCLDEDRWPGYCNDDVVTIGMPRWAVRQLEDATTEPEEQS